MESAICDNTTELEMFPGIFLSTALLVAVTSAAEFPLVTTRDLYDGDWDGKTIAVEGTIIDQFRDELSPEYRFLQIRDSAGTAYASVRCPPNHSDSTNDYTGLKAKLFGSWRNTQGRHSRSYLGHEIGVKDPADIIVLDKCRQDPFSAPFLDMLPDLSPAEIPSLGRRRTFGQVIAVRQGIELLIRTRDGFLSRIELLGGPSPKPGEFIEVVGNVETDIHFINLSRARWRPTATWGVRRDSARDVTARQIVRRADGLPRIWIELHGKTLRMRALVRSLPDPAYNNGVFYVESDGITCPVDAGSCPDVFASLELGSVIELTGICWMTIENWRPNAAFPEVKGFALVLRTPDDVSIIAHPPWWTPTRLLFVICALSALILWFAIWNLALHRLAERRGRQLFREQATRMAAELKTAERSRLAMELHDSISQVLTGVALKIKAAQTIAKTDLGRALRNLSLAESTLRSSREELRYCLWDLRNNILDLPSLEEAIQQTLSPQAGDQKLTVRFPVSRRRISDNMAHLVLQIVRELTVNAIRHGNATSISIAGSLDNDILSFSVRDNGCGFDPTTSPGPEHGHFGLLGIRDRLARFNGTIALHSKPGSGTRAVVSLSLRNEEE